MNSTTAPSNSLDLPAETTRLPATARNALRLLHRLPHGRLDLHLPDGAQLQLPSAPGADPRARRVRPIAQTTTPPPASDTAHASLRVHDWRMFDACLRSGDIGLAESYLDGGWDTPDLAGLLRLAIANRDHLDRLVYGSWWGRLWHRLVALRNRNTRAGSKRNIHAHYDLGNDFYRLWLDPGMSYSSAWFEGRDPAGIELEAAQRAKFARALREAGVAPGSRVLEIGCGWGGLAELAARDFGAHVTGVTLSREQLAWGRERLARASLAEHAELRFEDYRDLPARHAAEPFDAVVSIEMFEAVGREYWRGYFGALAACLRPGGRACIQTITLRDDLFARYLRTPDFIQQYIFPGGQLPSVAAFEGEARRAGFSVENRLAFGRDYAETLRRWRASFNAAADQVQARGFDARFQRLWNFYLAYCEAAFDTGNTDVVQFTLRRD
ncbi:SAM-dependent methyltransferase [Derxia gummosa]|uniref:SAM-dependent methyltransferase n=1 Tax=Derxia gummosa DSM 723 TaxID=1121388 RepID=A0A8B6X551_9BURK|nr:cyclopropane-fatty-acyl-phospholipid synthase family protein [Derxia gummosa]